MRSLSVVIPAWSGTQALADMLLALCEKVRPMCDELVVSEDSGNDSELIARLADTYLHHSRLGHVQNLKLGMEACSQEFIAAIDSDILIESGNLRDLCIPEKLVYPTWSNWLDYRPVQKDQGLWQWFVVAPRDFFKELPPFTVNRLEGLDEWGDAIRERFPIFLSDKVVYQHTGRTSYGIAKLPS